MALTNLLALFYASFSKNTFKNKNLKSDECSESNLITGNICSQSIHTHTTSTQFKYYNETITNNTVKTILLLIYFITNITNAQTQYICGGHNVLNSIFWCIDMIPAIYSPTSHQITLSKNADGTDYYFHVSFTVIDRDCIEPRITFKYEQIDYDETGEYLNVYDHNNIAAICKNDTNVCGSFATCLNNVTLNVDKITKFTTYRIDIYQSSGVNNLCNSKSINAIVTLSCYPPPPPPTTLLPTTILPTTESQTITNNSCGVNQWCIDIYPPAYLATSYQIAFSKNAAATATNFYVSFTPIERDCLKPRISFDYEEIDYDMDDEYLQIYNNNNVSLATCGSLQDVCGTFGTCINNMSLNISRIEKNTTYQIRIFQSSSVHNLCTKHPYSTNARVTLYCDAPTAEMQSIDGSYRCNTLTNNISVLYNINYNQCLEECRHIDECFMISYLLHGKTSLEFRCYIFDKQCDIINDNIFDGTIAIKRPIIDDICINYPIDWSDIYDIDTSCSYYIDHNWCSNGAINDNLTGSSFTKYSDKYYGFNAIQTCCDCGGGLQLVNDTTLQYSMTFNGISGFKNSQLCQWGYNGHKTHWNHMNLFDLCIKMQNKIYNSFQFILNRNQTLYETGIDCNIFIDNVFSVDNEFIVCDFNTYINSANDLYFISIFDINFVNEKSFIYINSEWVTDTTYLLHTTQSYHQCIQSLSSTIVTQSTLYGIFPCGNNNFTQIFTTTNIPTNTDISTFATTTAEYTSYIQTLQTTAHNIYVGKDASSSSQTTKTVTVIIIILSVFIFLLVLVLIGVVFYIGEIKSQSVKQLQNINNINDAQSRDKCILCCDQIANMFNYPCGHVSYCTNCSIEAIKTDSKCPNCQQLIKECKTIYSGGFKPNKNDENIVVC
eukprot:236429_1